MHEEKGSKLYPSLSFNDLNKQENAHAENVQNGNGKTSLPNHPPGRSDTEEKKDYKYFWRRVFADLTNKDLIPVKILFFFKYATLFVLYPFLTLHMNALGLNEWEIGVNQATAPVVAILGPPVAGMLADKIGNFKIVLSFITLVNAAVALLLLLVPTARETITFPSKTTFEMSCDPVSQHFILNSVDPYVCSLNSTAILGWANASEGRVIQCGQWCIGNMTSELENTFPELPLGIDSHATVAIKNQSYTFFANYNSRPTFVCDSDGVSEHCKLGVSYNNVEDVNAENVTTPQSVNTKKAFSRLDFTKLELINAFSGDLNSSKELNVTEPQFRLVGPLTFNGERHDSPTCSQTQEKAISPNADDQQTCETKCFIQMERKQVCENDSVQKVNNVELSFGLYTLFRLLLGLASATSFIMFEGAVLAILKQFGGDYGLQRVSATLAAIISAPLAGLLLQYYSFKPIFYLYAALQAFSAVLTLKIDLQFKKPSENVLGHLKEVLSQIEILIFFLAMLISGTAWGYLETFLFLFLKQLGGSTTLMGLTISVGGLFGLPFLVFSRPIVKKMGHVNVICLGLFFYGVRYFGYSQITNPWLCLPFEAMEAITASLAITAAATYAVAMSTLQTIASIQGMMGALYFGIGRGAGSFLGGMFIRQFGYRLTFQIFGIGSFVACALYVIVNFLYLRRHSKAASGIDINNMSGAVFSNGAAKMRPEDQLKDQFQMKPANHDSELGYGKVNPGFDDGDSSSNVDSNRFTDIPLDEDNQSTLPNNKQYK